MRLIDADTLRAEFTGNFGRELWHYTGIRATIEVAPTIDAVPAVHAHWVDDRDSIDIAFGDCEPDCHCSACGKRSDRYFKYCPNCGAKMDEEEKA